VIGAAVGFGVGVGAGYLASKGLRAAKVDKVVAKAVTTCVDGALEGGARVAGMACKAAGNARDAVGSTYRWGARKLSSIFGH
jgi:hypothetical protein